MLLLDEPFTGLDAPCATACAASCDGFSASVGLSTVIVTHDPEEAALLADELVVLDDGRVLQAGTRAAVFRAPASPQVAALLGIANAHRGVARRRRDDRQRRRGAARSARPSSPPAPTVAWSVRPSRSSCALTAATRRRCSTTPTSATTRELTVALEGVLPGEGLELTVRTLAAHELLIGQKLRVELPPEHVSVWPLPRRMPARNS